jgi:hypothetical protein
VSWSSHALAPNTNSTETAVRRKNIAILSNPLGKRKARERTRKRRKKRALLCDKNIGQMAC